MLRILVFIAVASALAFGAVWLAERPGEVSIVWGGMTIETTVAMAAIGVAVLVLAGMMLWSLLRFMLGLPTAFSFASRARKRSRGYEAISRGMVAIGAGDPSAARRHASDARKLIPDEPLSLLLSAQSAQLSGDKPAAEAAFKDMLDEPTTRVLGLRGLFVEARRRGDQIAARAFADEAVRLSPSLAWANDALLEFHSTAGDWAQARTAVERRAALRLSDKTESRRHRAVLLAAEALAKQEASPADALSAALEALKLAPGLTPAAALAGRMLSAKGELRKAARVLEAAWREQPHPDLAAAYVNLRTGDSLQDKLDKAQALMKLKPTDPESVFAVTDAAIAARDYPLARKALLPLLAAVPTQRACLLMARIEDGEHGSAGRAREWLTRSVRAPRDNAWVADGIVSETWLPVSPVSGRLDAFAWTLPPPVLGSTAPAFEDFGPLSEPASAPPVPAATAPPAASPLAAPSASPLAPPSAEAVSGPDRTADDADMRMVARTVAPVVVAAGEGAGMIQPATGQTVPEQHAGLSGAAAPEPHVPPEAAEAGASAPVPAHGPVLLADGLPRAPDDPGPEPDAAPPAKRSFWGLGR
ncbi:MAG: heme biosynthesis protein HemY [Beijerinckiaceae bacterium]|nr:heme biosynthesis protein HemY [Beijerinckiaceae bacterium]